MKKTGRLIKCPICKTYFYAAKWALKLGRKLCSTKCRTRFIKKYKLLAGKNNPAYLYRKPQNYKYKNYQGYILIKDYKHPNRTKGNNILEHIKKIEKHLKRLLKPGELVHHINFIRDDNKIKNLHVFSSIQKHNQATKSLHQLANILLKKQIIYFNKKTGEYYFNENCL